jgi:hypothetical protein
LKDISDRLDKVIQDKTVADKEIIKQIKGLSIVSKAGNKRLASALEELADKADNDGLKEMLNDFSLAAAEGMTKFIEKVQEAKLEVDTTAALAPLEDLPPSKAPTQLEPNFTTGTIGRSYNGVDGDGNPIPDGPLNFDPDEWNKKDGSARLKLSLPSGEELVVPGVTDVSLSSEMKTLIGLKAGDLERLKIKISESQAEKVHDMYLAMRQNGLVHFNAYTESGNGAKKFNFLQKIVPGISVPLLPTRTRRPAVVEEVEEPPAAVRKLDAARAEREKKDKGKGKKGSGLKGGCLDVNEKAARLKTLLGSYSAGNKNNKTLKNEVSVILDDLLKAKAITKPQHKKIYNEYVR